MVDYYIVYESASSFVSHLHELHTKINDMITQNNVNCKLRADVRKKLRTFNVGGGVKKIACACRFKF